MHAARRQFITVKSTPTLLTQRAVRDALRLWFCLGLFAMAWLPEARGASLWIGYLPYWLVAAPLISMAVLDRQWLRQTWIPRAVAGLRFGKRRAWSMRNRRIRPRAARRTNGLRASLVALVSGRR